uniref:Uncharacterized protein n=1 Tax=Vespula pensylvanica TaxID=30213 RepID=A0A834PEL9_VESPE|nr:hypothetical protein H0235_000705 [Vespula pensylvanica]
MLGLSNSQHSLPQQHQNVSLERVTFVPVEVRRTKGAAEPRLKLVVLLPEVSTSWQYRLPASESDNGLEANGLRSSQINTNESRESGSGFLNTQGSRNESLCIIDTGHLDANLV